MDSWFPTLKIYNRNGQLYTAVDAELMLAYKESQTGQILHEGISEAVSCASFTAVGTSYSTHNEPMIPSTSSIRCSVSSAPATASGPPPTKWPAASSWVRRPGTTPTGEGLQHADGHSQLLASTNPAVVATTRRSPTGGLHHRERPAADVRGEPENICFSHHHLQRAYVQPAEPENFDRRAPAARDLPLSPRPCSAAAPPRSWRPGWHARTRCGPPACCAERWDVAADVWSVTSWNELHRDGLAVEKDLLRHPDRQAPTPSSPNTGQDRRSGGGGVGLDAGGAEQIGRGSGHLRHVGYRRVRLLRYPPGGPPLFNTDAESVVVAVLEALARDGEIDPSVAIAAAAEYRIDDVLAAPEQTSTRRRLRTSRLTEWRFWRIFPQKERRF